MTASSTSPPPAMPSPDNHVTPAETFVSHSNGEDDPLLIYNMIAGLTTG